MCLNLQSLRVSQSRNQHEVASSSLLYWFLDWFIRPSKRKRYVSSKRQIGSQRATRHYIPKDRTLYNHRCDSPRDLSAQILLFQRNLIFVSIKINQLSHAPALIVMNPQGIVWFMIAETAEGQFMRRIMICVPRLIQLRRLSN
jgi:hypothetical protein